MKTSFAHVDERKSVGQVAATAPQLVPILEEQGIDYYCRGNRSIKEACEAVGLETAEVTRLLSAVPPSEDARNWMASPLTELTNHLIAGHHARAREIVPSLQQLAHEVCTTHKDQHPELRRICTLFKSISDDLLEHMRGEEAMLFPQVEALERAALEGKDPESPYVGGLSHRILIEYHEHDMVAEKMRKLRELTSNYLVPEDCPKYRAFFEAMETFERDLHDHMHLENNVLFPRSGVLESNVKLRVAGPW